MFDIKDDKTHAVTKKWVEKLGGKYPTPEEVKAAKTTPVQAA